MMLPPPFLSVVVVANREHGSQNVAGCTSDKNLGPKNLDSKRNQEALRLGVFGTATKRRNTAWTCCRFAFCAHESLPLLMGIVCIIHQSCTTAFCAMWLWIWQCPQPQGRLPLPAQQMPAQSPATALALCPCCQHMESLPQVKHWRCPWVSSRLGHPPCWKPIQKDLCLGL